jgi:type I restriction enzyme R subunit
LLLKPELNPQEIKKIKKVAKNLLKELKTKLAKLYKWKDREPMRDDIKILIKNFLWDDKTGLPVECYSINDVEKKAEEIFYHIYRAYPTIPSPYYETVA